MNSVIWLGVKITPKQQAILDELTTETGRTKSNITRSVIMLAGKDASIRQRLGVLLNENDKQREIN